MDFFSPAQCVGYLAFVLGVTAFLQKRDTRLKFFNSLESLSYAAHFTLMGNYPAVVSGLVSCTRSMIAIKVRSRKLAVFFMAVNIIFGALCCKSPWGMLTVVGSSMATWAVFNMQGLPMRLVFFAANLCWLSNNIISRSIGGTVLETFIALSNGTTMIRLLVDSVRQKKESAKLASLSGKQAHTLAG